MFGRLPLLALLLACASAGAAEVSPADSAVEESLSRCFALRRSEPAAAVALAERILARPLSPQNRIKTLSCLGMAAGIAGNRARAIATADEIDRLMGEQALPPDFQLRAFSNAGAIYHNAGAIPQAESMYRRAYAVAQSEESDLAQISMLINIALIHGRYLDAPDVADGYYREALTLSEGVEDYDPTLLYYNYAANLARLGRDQAALSALDVAQAGAAQTDNTLLRHRVDTERAGLLLRQGQTARAHQLLMQAIAAQQRLPDPAGEAASLARLSQLQLATGDASSALRSAEQALSLAQTGDYRAELIEALEAQTAAHAALGQTQQALAAQRQQYDLRISALKQHDRAALADLQARLQDAAGVREVERLRQESRAQGMRDMRETLARNSLIGVLFVFVVVGGAFSLYQRRLNRRLHELSSVDPLTGLNNRRSAHEKLAARAALPRHGGPARDVLLLIDIDHFKRINDVHGHDLGDRVLVEVSRRLLRACRPDDIVARWGGEEFLVACGSLTQEQAGALAERLRAAAADVPIALPEAQLPLTVSIGMAPFPFFHDAGTGSNTGTWQDALKLADYALYAVKRSGRNGWAAIWGQTGARRDTLEAILKNPAGAEHAGDVVVLGTRRSLWSEAA